MGSIKSISKRLGQVVKIKKKKEKEKIKGKIKENFVSKNKVIQGKKLNLVQIWIIYKRG